jgi:hypothetical protein
MITDKWASYGAAKREILPGVEQRQHKRSNNRGKFAPTNATKGAAAAAVQIGRPCPARALGI